VGAGGKLVPLSDVLREAEAEGIASAKAEAIIENLKRKGDIHEPRHGFLAKT